MFVNLCVFVSSLRMVKHILLLDLGQVDMVRLLVVSLSAGGISVTTEK